MNERECTTGIGDLKGVFRSQPVAQDAYTAQRREPRWTVLSAMAGLIVAILFSWGFLHVVLTLIFTSAPIHH
ncbi:hypothetical protein [Paraburkholderia terricola]|uniref:Uncharacterized protein n=1 Tax=Paraburkholderia terricola TaxID=169427 RepID=A0A1M6WE52_9BURK|nr:MULTISPECIES: hypothetical protein [Paraburkholderia]SDP17549.1 hypothetical protein SAMN05192547_104617 [Paraburkholderia sediminicola]SHK91991.1 hypothetical protein SAMN05192548_104531 [Paraburkholderia terricola]